MRKTLRRIVVDGQPFQWLLPWNSLEFGTVHLSVFAEKRTQPLRIDPYPWNFEIRPATIANAIRFALRNGWTPAVPGPDFHIAFHEGEFIVLPPGIKFVHQLRSA
jgi:hypothetical protein